jgi:RhtB (resistance to homoserine/threonine) family protein
MHEWLIIISISLLAVISPGPDFAMVTRSSLMGSRRAGALMAVGIGGGVLLHVSYTLFGLGLLIRNTPFLFAILKIVGVAWLVWMGVKMMQTKPLDPEDDAAAVAIGDLQALRTGFLTNALNPKTTIFIFSLFMQVVQSSTPIVTQIAYGLFIAAAHVTWFALVALFFTAPSVRGAILQFRHWIDRVFGAVIISFGVALALANFA